MLEDPENMISSQNIIPLVSDVGLHRQDRARCSTAISAELTTDDLIALRDRVEGDEKASAATAAKEWLEEKGLI